MAPTKIDTSDAPRAPLTIRVVDGPRCPRCGSPEVLLGGTVRPFKVDAGRGGWESHCDARILNTENEAVGKELIDRPGCNIWFLEDGTITEDHSG